MLSQQNLTELTENSHMAYEKKNVRDHFYYKVNLKP